ncbi:hypothetical protein BDA96_10G082500 [Sorghum bicolor]|uniref:Uncharacterized protein n=2 Tax=Sorghum bicolor TaxID=4558 RepID=A0A921Q0Q2_SORBI|nr:hypothetical protein BDA96_10G082500 [Sorghum bicolor]OQU75984.1 hypothetical protein SORBI_3010G068950 [Sorghum bicolor]
MTIDQWLYDIFELVWSTRKLTQFVFLFFFLECRRGNLPLRSLDKIFPFGRQGGPRHLSGSGDRPLH